MQGGAGSIKRQLLGRPPVERHVLAQEVRERLEHVSHTRNKAAVKIYHTKESLQGLQVIRLLKIRNGRHVLVEGCDAGGVDFVAEKINRGGEEDTLVRVQAQPSRPEALEDFSEMLLVRLFIRAENQYIININEDKWYTSKQTIT